MDHHSDSSDFEKDLKSSKPKKKESPSLKKSSGFAKLASKVKRKSSFKKEKQEKKVVEDPVFSSTDDNISNSDQPVSPADSGVPNSPPMSGPTLVPLSKLSSKSEDSLDSGIYSRQKSCDSVDSIGSSESSGNSADQLKPVMSYTLAGNNPHPLDDYPGGQPMSAGRYEDYWREYQDIRQSIIVHDEDIEERRNVTRTDSGEDEDVSDWIRQAGFVGLVTSASLAHDANSGSLETSGNSGGRLSTDSLTSMTILNTLTEPQRKAVLRRITSFNNRAQKSKRRPIRGIFPSPVPQNESQKGSESAAAKPPSGLPHVEVSSLAQDATAMDEKPKSTSLPYNIANHSDGSYQYRRYSEVTHRPASSSFSDTDSPRQYSLTTAFSTSSLDTQPDLKIDRKGYQRKEPLHSIVATESTACASHPHPTTSPLALSSEPLKMKSSLFRTRGRSLSLPQDDIDVSDSDTIDDSVNEIEVTQNENLVFTTHSTPINKQNPTPLFYGSTTDLIYIKSRRQNLPPIVNALPNKSFLHSKSKRILSNEFTSTVTEKSGTAEPFEFSPITLTTSIVTVRQTKVIRSSPNNRSGITTSVFSNPSGPITSVLPHRSSPASLNKISDASETRSDSPSSLKENPIASSSSENDLDISFTSSLTFPEDYADQIYHTMPRPKRHSSVKSRRVNSTNQSPRRKSIKSLQKISLPKVSSLSISSLSPLSPTSPKRMGSYKLRRNSSPKMRRLKRSSSLYGEPVGSYHSNLDVASSSNRNSTSL